MNPIIRSAERAAYILDVSPQAFESKQKEGSIITAKLLKVKIRKPMNFILILLRII